MTLKRRLQRLEGKHGRHLTALDIIVISMVAPGPEGPVCLGGHFARILTGKNTGVELVRGDNESNATFEARCDAMLQCAL